MSVQYQTEFRTSKRKRTKRFRSKLREHSTIFFELMNAVESNNFLFSLLDTNYMSTDDSLKPHIISSVLARSLDAHLLIRLSGLHSVWQLCLEIQTTLHFYFFVLQQRLKVKNTLIPWINQRNTKPAMIHSLPVYASSPWQIICKSIPVTWSNICHRFGLKKSIFLKRLGVPWGLIFF